MSLMHHRESIKKHTLVLEIHDAGGLHHRLLPVYGERCVQILVVDGIEDDGRAVLQVRAEERALSLRLIDTAGRLRKEPADLQPVGQGIVVPRRIGPDRDHHWDACPARRKKCPVIHLVIKCHQHIRPLLLQKFPQILHAEQNFADTAL